MTPPLSASIPALAPGELANGLSDPTPFSSLHAAARHTGQPLDRDIHAPFGARLGTDLSDVRIHTDEPAARAAETIQARAYTVGKDIVFGAGQYRPDSIDGRHLLAHELAHVAQPQGPASRTISRQSDSSEREAGQAADALVQGKAVSPQATASAAVQREPLAGADSGPGVSLPDRLLDNASPFLAAAVASTTLNDFDTGKSVLKPGHLAELRKTAHNITQLLVQYPQSTVSVIGHTDTVGTEANNLSLGQARATATAEALEKLGVPAAVVGPASAGEAAPQAVQTKDETPNAQNRRVDVRFQPKAGVTVDMVAKLKPKASDKEPGHAATITPVQLNLPRYAMQDPDQKGPPFRQKNSIDPEWFKSTIPPAPKGSGPKSLIDAIGEKMIDPVIDRVAHGLHKPARDKIKEAARSGVTTGAAKMARMAAERAGVKDSQALDAIEKATAAAIQQKGNPSP